MSKPANGRSKSVPSADWVERPLAELVVTNPDFAERSVSHTPASEFANPVYGTAVFVAQAMRRGGKDATLVGVMLVLHDAMAFLYATADLKARGEGPPDDRGDEWYGKYVAAFNRMKGDKAKREVMELMASGNADDESMLAALDKLKAMSSGR